ncbi:hypothetical protein [Vibrio parahaemolyticus]|uniref:hypothetical protein n=1 Tax=Vibrio parahaemolyticus TaxID=670 RepID=UPI000541C0E5|nr:hypothetical protein [Vibrio parahaemolyticus]ELU8564811.1 hypothetical protein [Vibrio parahaemolyticus]KHF15993.1 hypothetical protein PO80_08600 [Vibrio parahaemolyticus]MDS1792065.1 hypothetical protein [Vibrio parahaemolyticus]OTV94139.1 hypothetical protein BA739_24470 [Vibrio parahaemolyticus]OTW11399.1 hypothetical protein BA740_02770 [Vibrio parahaemolyticus]
MMTLEYFIELVNNNLAKKNRDTLLSNALLELAKNKKLLDNHVLSSLDKNGFTFNESYNHFLFTLYSSEDFSIRLTFWKPVLNPIESDTFIYKLKHNHDFEIFMTGYSGDGYETIIYQIGTTTEHIKGGTKVVVLSSDRIKLATGVLIHMKPYTEIHEQLPPKTLSSSLALVLKGDKSGHIKNWEFDDNFVAVGYGVASSESAVYQQLLEYFKKEKK